VHRTLLLVISILSVWTLSALAASAPRGLRDTTPGHSSVIHPRLEAWAEVGAASGRVWLRFTDRGSAAGQQVPLTQRATNRRLQRGIALNTPERQPVAPEYIRAVQEQGGRIHRISRWLNAVSVDYEKDVIRSLAALPFIKTIQPVARYRRPFEPPSDDDLDASRAPAAGTAALNYGSSQAQLEQINVNLAHDRGLSGAGVLLAMFDTGFFKDHATFADAIAQSRLVAEWDFVFDDGNVQNEAGDDPGAHFHGTSSWSTAGGTTPGVLYGPAYGASFLLAKTEDIRSETQVEEDNWMAAVEWADSLGADVISSSLTYSDWYTFADFDGNTAITTLAANMAATLGIVVCNSAGNGGPGPSTFGAPADGHYIVSVGSVTSTGSLSSFSSRGPTFDGRIKPEVCARGSSTYLAKATTLNTYGTSSGTSFSCPLVAGCVVLILEANPTWNPLMVREALMQTADNASTPNNDFGWGIVDVNSAIDYTGSIALSSAAPPDTLFTLNPGYDVQVATNLISPVDMAGSTLYYRTDSASYVSAAFTLTGDTLTATIAAPASSGTVIDYYTVVKDSVGFTSRLPEGLGDHFTLTWVTISAGDMNKDGVVTSADIIELVNFVFKSGPAPDPLALGEINGVAPITSADIIHLLNYVFKGGPPPAGA
jgi:serine protease AprX